MTRKEKNIAKRQPLIDDPAVRVVLKTKIRKPPIREEFIERKLLIDRIESNKNLPLTLISAATGCGKSVTASQWLEQTNHKYGWLSLDEEHNDVNVFLAYLVSVLKAEWTESTFGLESLIDGVNLPAKLISRTLINDLDQLEELFVLVLDDYHLIEDEKIHKIINDLLQYPPEYFHLMILTQRDPPLKLVNMRAKLRLHEVRMKDLAFTNEEAIELSTKLGAKPTDEQINTLVKYTDGWITAITAGLMVFADGVEFERVIQATDNRNLVISGLLDEVVMRGMGITTQKFLELTVLFDRFSIELIDAMVAAIQDEDLTHFKSRAFIDNSIRRNLFLVPLDSSGQWYRYHHFFRDQLRSRLGTCIPKDKILKLYKTASHWFEKENYIEEALQYAILSEDMTFAINMFDRIRNELFNTEQFQRLDRLIELFPTDTRNSHLELAISLAMLQDHKGNFPGMEKYLSRASLLLRTYSKKAQTSQIKKLTGEFHSVSTFLPYILGHFDRCIIESEKCLKLLPARQPNYFREFALAYYVFAKQAQGKAKEGIGFLEENLESLSVANKYFRGRQLFLKSMVYGMEADTNKMYKSALQLSALAEPHSFPGEWMAGIYYLATSSYMSNKLEEVDRFHQELWKYRYAGRPFWVIHNLIVMGLASVALGQWDKVKNYVNKCLELSSELEIEPLKGMVYAFKVEIALRRNDIEQAIELSALANFEPHPPIFYYYYPQLTRVKLFIQTDIKEKGIKALKELLDVGKKRNNVNLIIQALALQATIYADESNHTQAKKALNEALTISKNKGLIRAFLDFGDPMYQLLKELDEEKQGDSQIQELLQAFRKESNNLSNKEQIPAGRKLFQENTLSDREIEILMLVTRGYKNSEIAETLFVSLDTVKKHLYNAYQKLYVKNRTSAIKKVYDLGLVERE